MEGILGLVAAWTGISASLTHTTSSKTSRGFAHQLIGTGQNNPPRSRHADWSGIPHASTHTTSSKTSRGIPWHLGRAAIKGWPLVEWTVTPAFDIDWGTPWHIEWDVAARASIGFDVDAPSPLRWDVEAVAEVSFELYGAGSGFWTVAAEAAIEFDPSSMVHSPVELPVEVKFRMAFELRLRAPTTGCLEGDGDWTSVSPGGGPRCRAY